MAYLGSLVLLGLAPVFFEPRAQGCSDCAANLVAITSAPGLVSALQHVGMWFGVVWSAGLALLVVRRLVRSPAAARRASAPLLVPLTVYLVAVLFGYIHAVGDGELVVDQMARRLWSVEAVALIVLPLGFVAGAIRARRARQSMARAVVALAESPAPGELTATLARTLGDPELQIAYPMSDGRHVDDAGNAVDVPPGRDESPPRSSVRVAPSLCSCTAASCSTIPGSSPRPPARRHSRWSTSACQPRRPRSSSSCVNRSNAWWRGRMRSSSASVATFTTVPSSPWSARCWSSSSCGLESVATSRRRPSTSGRPTPNCAA